MKVFFTVEKWDVQCGQFGWFDYVRKEFESYEEALDWLQKYDEDTKNVRCSEKMFRIQKRYLLEKKK